MRRLIPACAKSAGAERVRPGSALGVGALVAMLVPLELG